MSDSSDEGEKLLGDGRTGKDLSSFLAKVDEIGTLPAFDLCLKSFDVLLEIWTECFDVLLLAGDLVHGLITSTDGESGSEAIKKADAYLQRDQLAESRANPSSLGGGGQDRTIINRGPPKNVGSGDSVGTAASAAAPTSDMGRSCTALYISINGQEGEPSPPLQTS